MDCLGFNNLNHGVGSGDMCDEAHTCLAESKEKEDSGKRRDEWRELLQQTESRSKDDFADYTHTSFDTAVEAADGQWRARF
jgi:hypothetical protein